MFRPRIGQQLLVAMALGLFLLPAVSRATTVTIPKPFDSQNSAPASLSVTHDISINNDGSAAPNTVYYGTLNLNNNDIIFIPSVQDSAHAIALYNKVNDMVRSGSNSASWNGTGIMSQLVADDWGNGPGGAPATGGHSAMGVGVLLNDGAAVDPSLAGQPIYGGPSSVTGAPFDGNASLTQFDTIVKYTFLGDTLLRGFIDTFDVSKVNNNFDFNVPADPHNTWASGDFFYEQSATGGSPPDTFDLSAVNNGFDFNQALYPTTVTYGQTAAAGLAVPEPSSVVLMLMGALAFVGGLRMKRRS